MQSSQKMKISIGQVRLLERVFDQQQMDHVLLQRTEQKVMYSNKEQIELLMLSYNEQNKRVMFS